MGNAGSKKIVKDEAAKGILVKHNFRVEVVHHKPVKYLHVSLEESKLPEKVATATRLGIRLDVSLWLEHVEKTVEATVGGMVSIEGKLFGLTTAHGFLGHSTAGDSGEKQDTRPVTAYRTAGGIRVEGSATSNVGSDLGGVSPGKGTAADPDIKEPIRLGPRPAASIAAFCYSEAATASMLKLRQVQDGNDIREADWALVELPEHRILPNLLLPGPADELSDCKAGLWPTKHSSEP